MSSKTAYATPPESFVHPPLTPPASHDRKSNKPTSSSVAQIITHLRLRQAGHSDASNPWTVFPLSSDNAERLFAVLQADEALWAFVQDKVRYDYFSSSSRFVLRMPTWVHESFGSKVVFEIQKQLSRIASGGGGDNKAAEFARLVEHHGSPRLYFPIDSDEGDCGSEAAASRNNKKKQFDPHEPDAVFKHSAAHWPGVIIEVSFSQKRKMLQRLAEDYIFGSDGSVRVVVGLDIEYRKSKKATLSVWRSQLVVAADFKDKNGERRVELVCRQTVVDQEFRAADGNPVGGATGLELHLRDFAPDTLLNTPSDHRITIPSTTLFGFLTDAELDERQKKTGQGEMVPCPRGVLKRRRVQTPEEDGLLSEDEQGIMDKERAAKRTDAGDGEYVPDEESD